MGKVQCSEYDLNLYFSSSSWLPWGWGTQQNGSLMLYLGDRNNSYLQRNHFVTGISVFLCLFVLGDIGWLELYLDLYNSE